MTSKFLPAFLFSLGGLVMSIPLFANAHNHGVPLTEIEQKASEGIFENKDVQDRPLSDWDGVWESLNSYLLNGDLDPVLEQKAKKGDTGKSTGRRRQAGKKVNFEPDSAFRGEKKGKAKPQADKKTAEKKGDKKAKKPSTKTLKIAAATKAKRAAKKNVAQ